jgi:hypothetical protein
MRMGMGMALGRSFDKDSETPLWSETQAIADGFKWIVGGYRGKLSLSSGESSSWMTLWRRGRELSCTMIPK